MAGWTFIDCGLGAASSGHHYWELKALVSELVRRGDRVQVLSHQNPPASGFDGAELIPTFSLYYYWTVSNDPTWGAVENFVLHNRQFGHDLMQREKSSFLGSRIVFPTVSERQFLGAIRWLAAFPHQERPKVVFVLFPPLDWFPTKISHELYRELWKNCPAELKESIVLCVRTDRGADEFEKLFGIRPHVLPSPLGLRAMPEAQPVDTTAPLLVSFLGGTRPERGSGFLPEVARRCTSLNVRFFVQIKREGDSFDTQLAAELKAYPNVQVHEGILDEGAYRETLASSIALLPYRPDAYRSTLSGVYLEAKCLGTPVIVPGGTWMADEVRQFGSGIVFEPYSAEAVATAIAQAARDHARIRSSAAACARAFNGFHGSDRCADALVQLLN